jgi:hypothetical protein
MIHTWLDQYPFVAQLLQTPEDELVGYVLEDPSVIPCPTLCQCFTCVLAWGDLGLGEE